MLFRSRTTRAFRKYFVQRESVSENRRLLKTLDQEDLYMRRYYQNRNKDDRDPSDRFLLNETSLSKSRTTACIIRRPYNVEAFQRCRLGGRGCGFL